MQTVLEGLFTRFFTETTFPFFVFIIGFSVGTYAWLHEVYSRRSRNDDLSLIGKSVQLVFIGLMWIFYVLVAVAIILTLTVLVITAAASVAYLVKIVIPELVQSYEVPGGVLAVLLLCAVFLGLALIYSRNSIMEAIDRKFKRNFDPVKDCKEYRDNECSHVDGYLCNKTCEKHPDHVEELLRVLKERIDGKNS